MTAVVDNPQELQLPAIPAELRQPAQRAEFLVNHFWDNLDFKDIARSRNQEFMEQNFATWLSLFPHAPAAALAPAVGSFLAKAETDAQAYMLAVDLAEKYLNETESPMYSEEHYILFLEKFVESPVLGKYGSMRYQFQLRAALKNRPGTKAADVEFTTLKGRKSTLYATKAPQLLVLFYDNDCDHCKEVMAQLQQMPVLKRRVNDKSLTVLAVCMDGDPDQWQDYARTLPESWLVGLDEGKIIADESYFFRSMPSIYLLDAQKQVLMKNPALEELEERLVKE